MWRPVNNDWESFCASLCTMWVPGMGLTGRPLLSATVSCLSGAPVVKITYIGHMPAFYSN